MEICRSSIKCRQQDLCNAYSGSNKAKDGANSHLLSDLNCFTKRRENQNSPEYFNFSDVFSSDSAAELLEHTRINDHPINLLDNKQPFYSSIYNLGQVELEMLKIYIKANLANGFIRPSKSPAGAPILFVQKKDSSLRFYVNY